VLEGAAAGGDLPGFGDDRAELPAVGAGLAVAELLGLLGGGGFEGAGEESVEGGHGDLLHLVEGDVQSRPLVAPVLPDDDFAPLVGELPDVFEVGRRERVLVHGATVQRVAEIGPTKL
jgi:hypothetical protein